MQLHSCAAFRYLEASRGTVGNAKHPGPRQSILRTSYVGLQSALSPADTMSSRDSLPHNT